MHIAVSSDNNYSSHLLTLVCSILENNCRCEEIFIHILDNGIDLNKKKKIEDLIHNNNRKCMFYDCSQQTLPATYSRLMLPSLLNTEIKKIIYLDVDGVVVGSLLDLWNIEMEDYLVAGVKDLVPNKFKKTIGLTDKDPYINAGAIVVNLELWRKEEIDRKVYEFILKNDGNSTHYDQGVINAITKGRKKILPLKYNVVTPLFLMKLKKILEVYKVNDYYVIDEVNNAIKNPIFIHYVDGQTVRPWIKGCRHPKKDEYNKYYKKAFGDNPILKKDKRSLKIKIIYKAIILTPTFILRKFIN